MGDLIMLYDTETTGKANFQASYDAPEQPCLVQLGYKVVHPRSREVIYETGHLVDSTALSAWRGIEPEAQAIHGVSEEMIRMYGSTPEKTTKAFLYWAEKCKLFVAHNDSFDTKIMQCHAKRTGFHPDIFNGGNKYCTMMNSTAICKVPNANGRGGYKWPKLSEAYEILVDSRGFGNAHNALADVGACEAVFWKLVDKGIVSHVL